MQKWFVQKFFSLVHVSWKSIRPCRQKVFLTHVGWDCFLSPCRLRIDWLMLTRTSLVHVGQGHSSSWQPKLFSQLMLVKTYLSSCQLILLSQTMLTGSHFSSCCLTCFSASVGSEWLAHVSRTSLVHVGQITQAHADWNCISGHVC